MTAGGPAADASAGRAVPARQDPDSDEEVVAAGPLLVVAPGEGAGGRGGAAEAQAGAGVAAVPSDGEECGDARLPGPPAEVRDLSPCWWDPHFLLRPGPEGGALLVVRLRGLELGDSDVASAVVALEMYVDRLVEQGVPLAVDLEAAENSLTDAGALVLVDGLQALRRRFGAHVRVLKLWNNQLGDVAAGAMARLLAMQPQAAEEVHLSHNKLSARGFAELLAAIAMHPSGAYPRVDSSGFAVPCWLRAEHNDIAGVQDLLKAFEAQGLRYCAAPRDRSFSCSPARCAVGDVWDTSASAHVHLYCIASQREDASLRGQSPEQLVREAVAKLAALAEGTGDVLPVQGDSATAQGAVHGGQRADEVACRYQTLNVDPEKGAGLDLEATELGFRVIGLEGEPGQELQVGDVLLEIAGEPLWGLGEDDLEAAFGSRFAHGARLRIAGFDAVRGRAVRQRLPLRRGLAGRCPVLLAAVHDDVDVLCSRFGVQADIDTAENTVLLHGAPVAQRWALRELLQLLGFYLPELRAAGRPPCTWVVCDGPAVAAPPVAEGGFGAAGPSAEAPIEAARGDGLGEWKISLREQASELEQEDDLAFDPLDAPDDGPEVFEGEAVNRGFSVWRPLRLLILAGLPGAGKSTLAARMADSGWVVVNQDLLGSRQACLAGVRTALADGGCVVVDRCNVTCWQRSVWLGVADEHKVCAGCFWLDVGPEECGERVLRRFGHATLAAEPESLGVIGAFAERFEPPQEAEGFLLWRARTSDEIELELQDLEEVVEASRSAEARQAAGQRVQQRGFGGAAAVPPERPPARRAAPRPREGGDFQYVDVRSARGGGRVARVQFLRAVRRQVGSAAFSDQNLVQDWFFQEKIADPPEVGWLALHWILSCPRIRDVYRADADTVLEALRPSTLTVKRAADGQAYVQRRRRLPAMRVKRPPRGQEPEWYRSLHAGAPSAAVPAGAAEGGASAGSRHCAACSRELPGTSFSASQLRKKRRAPVCRGCVDGVEGAAESADAGSSSGHESGADASEPVSAVLDGSSPTAWVAGAAQAPVGCSPNAAAAASNEDVQQCAQCLKDLPRSCFTKAQLTKHRASPKCKDCSGS
ncbi:unnamed protein product [Prorocentrum cordatum]|uniref:HTH La-type RNA-binding domain-containing protein n=1 Tax=Prorocentrum cordatum TaxID=2364126 RepID=A0ABN9WTR3_9DINO|nr:unnamed protein product [Polarella glacialis]